MSQKLRKECLCYANNDVKTEHAALIVTTFVHNRAGFQTDGTPDNEIGNGWGCYDLGLQNENLILKATELGLSTLIMGLRDGDKIREMLSGIESISRILSPSRSPMIRVERPSSVAFRIRFSF